MNPNSKDNMIPERDAMLTTVVSEVSTSDFNALHEILAKNFLRYLSVSSQYIKKANKMNISNGIIQISMETPPI